MDSLKLLSNLIAESAASILVFGFALHGKFLVVVLNSPKSPFAVISWTFLSTFGSTIIFTLMSWLQAKLIVAATLILSGRVKEKNNRNKK